VKKAIQETLNRIVLRLAGDRWHWILAPSINKLWRRRDREYAWSGFRYLIDSAPEVIWGGVGGDSYTGWVYQQGYLSALLRQYTAGPSATILDFGCGFGKVAPITPALTYPEGRYFGLDIREECIEYCWRQYAHVPRVEFHCSRDYNATYSDSEFAAVPVGKLVGERTGERGRQNSYGRDWPVAEESVDLAVGMSVFTHLQEEESLGYMARIHEVLKPGGVAIFSMLIVGSPRVPSGFEAETQYIRQVHDFLTSLPPSHEYFTSNPERPEDAIGVSMAGLEEMVRGRLSIEKIIWGSVLGGQEPFPHELVILRKPT